MSNIVFSYFNLEDDLVEKIDRCLDITLTEYIVDVIPNVLFCDENTKFDEQFLEYLFNEHIILIRISKYSKNPFVLSVNDSIIDKYELDSSGNNYIKCRKSTMSIFKRNIEKLLILKVTPSFDDIPITIDITKNSQYMDNMVDYIEYLDMSEIGHAVRVAQYSKMLAESVNYVNPEYLYIAGILHDVGKSLISEDIRLAKRELTKEEYEEIKKHSLYSYKLLNKKTYDSIRDAILYHHERCNGSGYPTGTKNIPLESRIMAIADSYDAMSSSRIYANHKSNQDALQELKICANQGLYDKYLVDKFIELMSV